MAQGNFFFPSNQNGFCRQDRSESFLFPKNIHFMNEQNFDYLANQLKYTGFGEEIAIKLKDEMAKGQKDFTLFHSQAFGAETAVATLQFRKSETNDMYFFNRYSILVKNAMHPDAVKQTF